MHPFNRFRSKPAVRYEEVIGNGQLSTMTFNQAFAPSCDIYALDFFNLLPSATANLQWFASSDGGATWDTSGVNGSTGAYDNNFSFWLVSVVVAATANTQTAGILETSLNSVAPFGVSGRLYLTNRLGAHKTLSGVLTSMDGASGNRTIGIGVANFYRSTGLINAIQLRTSTGVFATGMVRLSQISPKTMP